MPVLQNPVGAADLVEKTCGVILQDLLPGVDFLFNINRLNVVVSRAQALAIVVYSEKLPLSTASTIEKMKKISLFLKLIGAD